MKNFDAWNQQKKQTDSRKKTKYFQVRDIFWARVGENVGFEQGGKGEAFMRPVLVYKKFNLDVFWAIPLTTQSKEGVFYSTFEVKGKSRSAILSQLRLFDARRLEQKIGKVSQSDFQNIEKAIRVILDRF